MFSLFLMLSKGEKNSQKMLEDCCTNSGGVFDITHLARRICHHQKGGVCSSLFWMIANCLYVWYDALCLICCIMFNMLHNNWYVDVWYVALCVIIHLTSFPIRRCKTASFMFLKLSFESIHTILASIQCQIFILELCQLTVCIDAYLLVSAHTY